MRNRCRLLAFVALAALYARPVEGAQTQVMKTAVDSVTVHDRARQAQQRFEKIRVAGLPWGWERARSRTDEIIGRLLLIDDGDEVWVPPPEPETISRARERLLETLDRAAQQLPADSWIAGQRVWYAVEGGNARSALDRLAGCRAEPWWCRSLEGFALHAADDFVAAEEAFDAALAAMPRARRERWLDPTDLFDRDARRAYRRLDPAERGAFVRRFWWLADPFYAVPGNDRLTEHFARHVQDRILENARSPFEMHWGNDLQEVLVRYGWPVGWERIRRRSGSLGSTTRTGVIGHDPPGERCFAPAAAVLEAPTRVAPGEWSIDDDGAPTTYAPRYAEQVLELDHQLAVFRRAGEAVAVVGWQVADSIAEGGAVEAALVVASGPNDPPRVSRHRTRELGGALELQIPWAPAVVSVEALAREAGRAARARYGLPIMGAVTKRPVVSDLLLLDSPGALPVSLDAAAPRARGSTRVWSSERLGVYWELYPGPGRPHEVSIAVALKDERRGFWRKLGSTLNLAGDNTDSVALEWSESIPVGTFVYPRSLEVSLPELPPGEYTLELTVRFADSSRAVANRVITVERRDLARR
jgi:hypothetical protein